MEGQIHGNVWQKWLVNYDSSTNRITFQNLDSNEYHLINIRRNENLDLALILRRLSARDTKNPKTLKNEPYKRMASKIIDRSQCEIYIRKGKWGKTVLTLPESIDLDDFLNSDKNYKEFTEESFDNKNI